MRIVSLCPSITESLVALGLAGELAGVTRYCIHPRDVVRTLRRVGGTKNPDLAAIREIRPDLVFLNSEENRADDIAALAAEGRVDVSHPRTAREVPALLRRFGALTTREEEAEVWARTIEEALSGVDAMERPSFRYVYLIWKDPWMTIGERTYIADLLRLAGGRSALAAAGDADYPIVEEDAIVAASPDVLILPDEPYRFRGKDRDAWAVRLPDADVRLVSGDDFCWHGVRTLRGIEAASALARSMAERHPVGRGA